MRLKHRELARQLQEIITRAQGLLTDIEGLCVRANTDMDDGIAGISYGGKGRGSGPADPVGSRAEQRRVDQVAESARVLRESVGDALRVIVRADKAGFALRALDPAEARSLTSDEVAHRPEDQTLSAQCANPACRRVVARSGNDRLRQGRCENCYRWRLNHGTERPPFLCIVETNVAEALALDESRVIVTPPCEDVA